MPSSSPKDTVKLFLSYVREDFDAVSALYDLPDLLVITNPLRLGLVRVPAGEFLMGTRTEDIAGLMKA